MWPWHRPAPARSLLRFLGRDRAMSRSRPLLAVTGLAVGLALWLSVSGPAEGAAGETSPCPGANADVSRLTVPQVRATLICVVNYERTAHGWPAFVVDDRLQRAAQKHVDDMAARGYFAHYSPEGTGPEERIEAEGYEWYSQRESLMAESRTVVEVISLFMGSSETCSYYFDQAFPVADIGVGFAMSGGPDGGPIWAQNLAAGPSSNMEGYDTAPEVSCPQPLRGDYGAPDEPQVDTDPPETRITKDAPKQTDQTKVKFKFRSDEAGSTFQCKLDKKPWKRCSSPKTVKRLDEGKHLFKVRAVDAAGNRDPTPAKDTFKVVD